MTKHIVLALALAVCAGCESEAPEPAMDVDAGAGGSSDCGAAAQADAGAMVAPELPQRAEYAVTFARVSDGELGACGFDLDQYIGHLSIDGAVAHWSADGEGGSLSSVRRDASAFATSAVAQPPVIGGVTYTVGSCAATVAADGSWTCEMVRHWVDPGDVLRCFNRYAVAGSLLP